MSGSNLVAIVVPIVMTPVLFAWIFAVFYAGSHPGYGSHSRSSISLAPERPSSATGVQGRQPGDDALGLRPRPGEPGGMRPHQGDGPTGPPPAD